MITYEYTCPNADCDTSIFEVQSTMSKTTPVADCPSCETISPKIIRTFNFQSPSLLLKPVRKITPGEDWIAKRQRERHI